MRILTAYLVAVACALVANCTLHRRRVCRRGLRVVANLNEGYDGDNEWDNCPDFDDSEEVEETADQAEDEVDEDNCPKMDICQRYSDSDEEKSFERIIIPSEF